jgi:ssDNA-binding Zn-finger/Zn-ribbon topoisomerase 1
MAREKGVGTIPCPECGTELKQVRLADGGVAAETCPKCFKTEKAAAKTASTSTSREKGTDTTEEK